VAAFRDRVPKEHIPVFKQMLRQVATLQRRPNGASPPRWTLKDEYR